MRRKEEVLSGKKYKKSRIEENFILRIFSFFGPFWPFFGEKKLLIVVRKKEEKKRRSMGNLQKKGGETL